jgi:hypothetical protein
VNSPEPEKVVIGGIHLGTHQSLGASCPVIGPQTLIDGNYTAERGSNGGIDTSSLVEYLTALESTL